MGTREGRGPPQGEVSPETALPAGSVGWAESPVERALLLPEALREERELDGDFVVAHRLWRDQSRGSNCGLPSGSCCSL